MNKILKLIFISIVMASLVSCATPGAIQINELNVPLVELQKLTMSSLPLGKRFESQNGRVYYSEYFMAKGSEFEPAEGQASRLTAQISILGDRRPYKIEVRVLVEKRETNGEYQLVKYDEGMARVISRRINSTLHKRRDDRNIIDDFRVF